MTLSNPDLTFGQQAERVHLLHEKLSDIRDRYEAEGADARRVNLNNVMMATNAAEATLRILDSARHDRGAFLTRALGLQRPEYINFVADDWLRASRLFLLVEAQFQTEALFRNILTVVAGASGKQGYVNLASEVLDRTGLDNSERLLSLLKLPALLRNSMHANGIHHGYRGADTVMELDDLEFRLEHGKPVHCGSWLHICVALTHSFNVVEAVLGSQLVKDISLIPDAYAEQSA